MLHFRLPKSPVSVSPLSAEQYIDRDQNCSALENGSIISQNEQKRPAEPGISLSDFIRARELEALVKTGKTRADEVMMGAGFMGGGSPLMIGFWLVGGGGCFGSLVLNMTVTPISKNLVVALFSDVFVLIFYLGKCTIELTGR